MWPLISFLYKRTKRVCTIYDEISKKNHFLMSSLCNDYFYGSTYHFCIFACKFCRTGDYGYMHSTTIHLTIQY